MTTTAPFRPAPTRPARRLSGLALLVGLASAVALVAIVVALLSAEDDHSGTTKGSGVAASETRTVPRFAAVDLAGTSELTVQVGRPQQVVVRADDNLIDQVLTEVHAGVLVVSDRGSFTSVSPMSVVVTVPALRSATLSGTGQLVVTGVAADTFTARLPGTGSLVASGRADRVDASVSGDGALDLSSLLATDATVTVQGTGSVEVHVSGSLEATVSGTGSVLYTGHPDSVTRTVTGVGSVSGS
jgi:hypothetical protein